MRESRVLSRISRSFGFDEKIEKKFLEHRSGKIYFCLCNEISTPQTTVKERQEEEHKQRAREQDSSHSSRKKMTTTTTLLSLQLRERQGGLGSYQGGFVLRTHSFGFYFYFLVVVVVVVVGN